MPKSKARRGAAKGVKTKATRPKVKAVRVRTAKSGTKAGKKVARPKSKSTRVRTTKSETKASKKAVRSKAKAARGQTAKSRTASVKEHQVARRDEDSKTSAGGLDSTSGARIRELENEISDLRHGLERSERRVEAMKQIGRALGSNLELDSLLLEIVSCSTRLLEADRSTLFLVDRPKRELWSKVLEGSELKEIRLGFGVGIAGWVAERGEPQHVRDAYEDHRFNPDVDKRSGYRTRSMLVWPVKRPHGTEIIGVIQVLNKRRGGFDGTDERLLEAIASEIGVALEVAALYGEAVDRNDKLEKARRELMLLFDTERAISESSNLQEMLGRIVGTALRAMSAEAGAAYVLDDQRSCLDPVASRGPKMASFKSLTMGSAQGVVGDVLRSGDPVCYNESVGERRGRLKVASSVVVPIQIKDVGIIGVLELLNKTEGADFDDSDIKALTVVGSQAGRAINAEKRRQERERSERLTAIGQMLSGVMHDIRTPLTLISGYTEMMTDSESRHERSEFAHRVNRQIDVLSSMTKELLAFARGERSVLIRKIHVTAFMSDILESLEREFASSNVKLRVVTNYRGAARLDETKLRRLFQNIARNAREAMPGGGEFTIAVDKMEDFLEIVFEDTGGGIPTELEGRLFEPFATAGKVGGTGLGLAMVRQIAEEHMGSVDYQSVPGRGTRFTVRLPVNL